MGELRIGAGEGNRTLVVSLEGFCSTIELHPLVLTVSRTLAFVPRLVRSVIAGKNPYQQIPRHHEARIPTVSRRQRVLVEGVGFEPT